MEITDAYFDKAFETLIKQEGGYVNHPKDPGGETKFGITKRDFPHLDIKNLTLQDAREIYYNKYWIPAKCDSIKIYFVAEKLFSLAVNMGIRQASLLLQRALRAADCSVVEDGIIGKDTLDKANKADQEMLLSALRSEAAGFYRMLAMKDSSQNVFLNGWLNRAYA